MSLKRNERLRLILSYLDQKAHQIKQASKGDPAPYATSVEISERLGIRMDSTCNALQILLEQNKIRIYPNINMRRRNRKYGSIKLPTITVDDVLSELPLIPMMSRAR